MMQPRHVQELLQYILDYWAREWGVERTKLTRGLPKKAQNASRRRRRLFDARRRRIYTVVGDSPLPVSFGFSDQEDLDDPDRYMERRLRSSVLRCAIEDWANDSVGPTQIEQRDALDTYFWIQGMPPLEPRVRAYYTAKEWEIIHTRGPTPKYWLDRDIDIRRELMLSDQMLFHSRDDNPQDPPGTEDTYYTFLDCCAVVGCDPESLRRYIHLVPPKQLSDR